MNGFEMLEKMEAISPDYVQEAGESFRREKAKNRGKIIPFYIAGMAAGFVLMLVSAGMLLLGKPPVDTAAAVAHDWAATAFGEAGSIALLLLIIAVAVTALFAVLLIRRKKGDG